MRELNINSVQKRLVGLPQKGMENEGRLKDNGCSFAGHACQCAMRCHRKGTNFHDADRYFWWWSAQAAAVAVVVGVVKAKSRGPAARRRPAAAEEEATRRRNKGGAGAGGLVAPAS